MATDDATNATPKKGEPGYRANQWRKVFLNVLAESCNVSMACSEAGIHRATAYRHKERFPKFSERWDDAIETGVDALYREARRRAVKGTAHGVWHQGKRVGIEREYSDTLLIFLMKAHRPETYRDGFDLGRALDGLAKRTTS